MRWFPSARAQAGTETGREARVEAPALPPEPGPQTLQDELGEAVDTLRSVLGSLGELSFDTDQHDQSAIRAQFDEMARRVAVGPVKRQDGERLPAARRDYRGVRLAVRQHREHEVRYVTSALANFREAVRACLHSLSSAIAEDRAADKRVGAQVGRLVEAFQTNDAEAIRREAKLVATLVEESIAQRRQREGAQMANLAQSVRVLRDELQEARARAERDALTELFNRAALDEHVRRTAELSLLGAGQPFLLMLDVDHFKQINDRFGHPAGDATLRAVVELMVRTFLRADDFVARYGGEEFAVVIVDSTEERVLTRAERLREAAARMEIQSPAGVVTLTVSIGVAGLQPGESASTWLERADRALYAAKDRGRNRVQDA